VGPPDGEGEGSAAVRGGKAMRAKGLKVRPFTDEQTACFARIGAVWPHAYVACAATPRLHGGAMRGLRAAGLVVRLLVVGTRRARARLEVWRLTPAGDAWRSRQLALGDAFR
jgi:hypothetical protein